MRWRVASSACRPLTIRENTTSSMSSSAAMSFLSPAGHHDGELQWGGLAGLVHDPTNRSTTKLRLSSHWATDCICEVAKLIYELLPELRAQRDLTVPELARITTRIAMDVPQKSIEALESKARAGQIPKRHTLEALAAAMRIEPDVFYEWPIAVAQAGRVATPSVAGRARAAARRLDDTQSTSPRTRRARGDSNEF